MLYFLSIEKKFFKFLIYLNKKLDEYKRQNFELNQLNAALENKNIEQQSYVDNLLDDMALMNGIKSDLQSDIHCLNIKLKSNEELTKKLEEAVIVIISCF